MTTSPLTRLGAACGALYVLLAILANDVLGPGSPDSTATAHEIGTWWRTHPATSRDWALGMLELGALLCFPVFVIVLAWILQRQTARNDQQLAEGAVFRRFDEHPS